MKWWKNTKGQPWRSGATALVRGFEILGDRDVDAFGRLRRPAGARTASLLRVFSGAAGHVAQLASGFARGEPDALAIPNAQAGVESDDAEDGGR